MMVMMVNVLLRDRTSLLSFVSTSSILSILSRQPAPDAESRHCRQSTAASRTSTGREIACPFLRGCGTVRQAMDSFGGGRNGIRTGFRPAKIGRQAVEKLVKLLIFGRLVVGQTGTLGIVVHCNLTQIIVGEFAA